MMLCDEVTSITDLGGEKGRFMVKVLVYEPTLSSQLRRNGLQCMDVAIS